MTSPIEIVFSFDTTSSMQHCIVEVHRNLKEITDRLFHDIPNIRIGFLAHGDYCDAAKYVTCHHDFVTKDRATDLMRFAALVDGTCGGDWEECYEYVMNQVQTVFSWTPGSQRALVMIGDAVPHDPAVTLINYGLRLNWEEEAKKLVDMGVRIYSVQCRSSVLMGPESRGNAATKFWKDLSTLGKGRHLVLEQFATIVDMFMAICYREAGAEYLEAFEKEIHSREGAGIHPELTTMFESLRDDASEASSGYASLAPTPDKLDATDRLDHVKRLLFPDTSSTAPSLFGPPANGLPASTSGPFGLSTPASGPFGPSTHPNGPRGPASGPFGPSNGPLRSVNGPLGPSSGPLGPASVPFGLSTSASGPFGLSAPASGPFGLSTPASGPFGPAKGPLGPSSVPLGPASAPFGLSAPASGPFGPANGPFGLSAPASGLFGLSTPASGPFGPISGPFGPASGPFGLSTPASGPFGLSTPASGPFGLSTPASGLFGIASGPLGPISGPLGPASAPFGLSTPASGLFGPTTPASAPSTISTSSSAPAKTPTRTPVSARAARAERRSLLKVMNEERRLRPSTVKTSRNSLQLSRQQKRKMGITKPSSVKLPCTKASIKKAVKELNIVQHRPLTRSRNKMCLRSTCGGHCVSHSS